MDSGEARSAGHKPRRPAKIFGRTASVESVVRSPRIRVRAENRFAPRRDLRLPASVTPASGGPAIGCRVLDLSATGLQIELRGGTGTAARLPDRVSVFVMTESVEFIGEIVWRAGARAGLRLVEPARHHPKRGARPMPATRPKPLIARLLGRH